jgi:hypothetical protein
MSRGGALRKAPPASECLVTLAGLEAWLSRARPGDWLIYQRGPWMVHDEVTRRVGELAREGLVDPAQPLSTTHSGCRDYKIQKRSASTPACAPGQGAAFAEAPDEGTEALLRILRRDANLGRRCRTNKELAKLAGLATTAQAAGRIAALRERGAIKVDTIEAGPEAGWRTVTIVSSGKQTQPPPSLAALKASIEGEG